MTLPLFFSQLSLRFLDLFFPISCLACGKEGVWICQHCIDQLQPAPPGCPFCHIQNTDNATCRKCRQHKQLEGLWASSIYRQPLAHEIVQGLKFRFWKGISDPMATRMHTALLSSDVVRHDQSQTLVVPIPLHRSRLRSRGFNQSEILARAVAASAQLAYRNVLIRVRATRQQARLHERERAINLQKAFVMAPGLDLQGKSVILIDDVFTTGATLEAAAQVCKQAGAKRVWGLVFAKGILKKDDSRILEKQ